MIQQSKRNAGSLSKTCRIPLCLTLTTLLSTLPASGAVVDYQLAALPTPSGSDTATTVPTSQPNFAVGSNIYLEIWVQTTNANGVSSASLDVQFNPSLASAVGVTHSPVFSTLLHSTINNQSGLIDDLSGSHLGPCTDTIAVTPNWARVAVVEFAADANGMLSIQTTATGSAIYGTALCGLGDVNPLDIGFDSVAVLIGDVAIPTTSTWGLITMGLLLLSAGTIALRRSCARVMLL